MENDKKKSEQNGKEEKDERDIILASQKFQFLAELIKLEIEIKSNRNWQAITTKH